MTALECVLTAFVVVLIVISIVVTVYLVKFLKEITLTMTSIKNLTDLTIDEIRPALITLNDVLKTVKNVSSVTNKQFELLKNILTALLGASCAAFGSFKGKGGFISGLVSGFNMFRKK